MMILSIKVLFVLGLFGFACALKKYVFSLLVLFGAMALELFENGLTNSWLLVGCEIVFIVLIVKETSLRKDKSILVKYNPMSSSNVLPQRLRFVFYMLFILALLLRLISVLVGRL